MSSTSSRAWFLACALLLSIATAASFWVVDYLPTNDGPDHVFSGHIENAWASLDERDRALVVVHAQLTAHGFRALYVPLERVLGWRNALRLTLTVWALIFAWGVVAIADALGARRRWLGLLGFPSSLQWALYMGFFSYWAATAFGFLALALALRRDPWRPIDRVLCAATLFIAALLHVFPAVLLGATLFCVVVARARSGGARLVVREVIGFGLCAAPAALVAVLTLGAERGTFGADDIGGWAERLAFAGRAYAPGPLWRQLPCLLLSAVGCAAALLRWNARSPAERGVAVAAISLLGTGFFAPVHLASWQFFSPRFVPMGVVLGLALVPVERLSAPAARIGAVAVGLFCALALAWSTGFHRELARDCAPALTGLSAPFRRTGFTGFLPLRSCFGSSPATREPWVPEADPLFKAAALYATEQGGLARALHGVRELHAITLLFGPPVEPRLFLGDWAQRWARLLLEPELPGDAARDREREALVTELAEGAASYDQMVLFGPRERRQRIEARGFVPDWEAGELSFDHYVGCPLEVELPPGWGQALVEYGWGDRAPFVRMRSKDPAATRLSLPRAPCGRMWFRVTSADGHHCAGADDHGRVSLEGRSDLHSVRCAAP